MKPEKLSEKLICEHCKNIAPMRVLGVHNVLQDIDATEENPLRCSPSNCTILSLG